MYNYEPPKTSVTINNSVMTEAETIHQMDHLVDNRWTDAAREAAMRARQAAGPAVSRGFGKARDVLGGVKKYLGEKGQRTVKRAAFGTGAGVAAGALGGGTVGGGVGGAIAGGPIGAVTGAITAGRIKRGRKKKEQYKGEDRELDRAITKSQHGLEDAELEREILRKQHGLRRKQRLS